MEGTLLYDLVEARYLYDYREELGKDTTNCFLARAKKEREELEKILNKEQLKLVDSYAHSLKLFDEDINILCDIKLLNIGVKIGMQLRKAFDSDEGQFSPTAFKAVGLCSIYILDFVVGGLFGGVFRVVVET